MKKVMDFFTSFVIIFLLILGGMALLSQCSTKSGYQVNSLPSENTVNKSSNENSYNIYDETESISVEDDAYSISLSD